MDDGGGERWAVMDGHVGMPVGILLVARWVAEVNAIDFLLY